MVTDFDIQALVDGELDDREKERVERYIESHSDAQKRYKTLLEQKHMLQIWWQNKKLH